MISVSGRKWEEEKISKRSLKVVDKLIIGVADNLNKKPLLSIDERKNIIANDIYSLQQNKIGRASCRERV